MRKTSAIPISKPILIHDLLAKGLRLREPLAVSLDYDESQVIAYCYDLDVFGYGETEIEALNDLRQTIVDLYFTLRENRRNLGEYAEGVWEYLGRIVERER
jgi:hypothetical protein